MSNWSLVIISYSGLEEDLPPDKLVELLPAEYRSWAIVYPCPDERSLGGTCETALVGHYNYFDMEEVGDVLRELPWRRPMEVCVIEKDETMTLPIVAPVFALAGRGDSSPEPRRGEARP